MKKFRAFIAYEVQVEKTILANTVEEARLKMWEPGTEPRFDATNGWNVIHEEWHGSESLEEVNET